MAVTGQREASAARVYVDLAGGINSSQADREIARALATEHPVLAVLTRQNRRYIERSVHQLASGGIAKFLDLGCGPPITFPDETHLPMVHEVARDAGVRPRTVYVDSDPMAFLPMAAVAAHDPDITVIKADLADPDSALIGDQLRELARDGEPAAIILGAVLHYWPADVAGEIVSWYMGQMPAGSAAVVTAAWFADDKAMDERRRLVALPFFNHSADDIESFLEGAGLRLQGRVTDVAPVSLAGGRKPALMLGGVGKKG